MLITWPEPAVRIYTMLYYEQFMLTIYVGLIVFDLRFQCRFKVSAASLIMVLGSLVSPGWVLELEIELTNFNMDPIFSC